MNIDPGFSHQVEGGFKPDHYIIVCSKIKPEPVPEQKRILQAVEGISSPSCRGGILAGKHKHIPYPQTRWRIMQAGWC